MTPINCFGCRHFLPNELNPSAGMGRCLHDARHGYFYPFEFHRCADQSTSPAPKDAKEHG